MKFLIGALLSLALAGCADSPDPYQTYVQVTKDVKPNQALVLVMATDQASPRDRRDTAMATFMLLPGESKRVVVGNKHYPGRRYEFAASLKTPVLSVMIKVSEGNKILFSSDQKLASWTGF